MTLHTVVGITGSVTLNTESDTQYRKTTKSFVSQNRYGKGAWNMGGGGILVETQPNGQRGF